MRQNRVPATRKALLQIMLEGTDHYPWDTHELFAALDRRGWIQVKNPSGLSTHLAEMAADPNIPLYNIGGGIYAINRGAVTSELVTEVEEVPPPRKTYAETILGLLKAYPLTVCTVDALAGGTGCPNQTVAHSLHRHKNDPKSGVVAVARDSYTYIDPTWEPATFHRVTGGPKAPGGGQYAVSPEKKVGYFGADGTTFTLVSGD